MYVVFVSTTVFVIVFPLMLNPLPILNQSVLPKLSSQKYILSAFGSTKLAPVPPLANPTVPLVTWLPPIAMLVCPAVVILPSPSTVNVATLPLLP